MAQKDIHFIINDNGIILDKNLKDQIKRFIKNSNRRKPGKYFFRIMKNVPMGTERQNSYLHGLIRIISDFTGNDFYEEKEILKNMYWPKEHDKFGREKPKSTANLTKMEKMQVIKDLHSFAFTFLNIFLPKPEEWLDYKNGKFYK